MNNFAKIFKILNKSQRWSISIIILLMILAMIIETVSIGLILPILTLAVESNQNTNKSLAIFSFVSDYLNFNPSINFFLICILVLFLIKFCYLIFINFFQSTFAYDIQKKLSNQIFSIYLNKNYSFHLNENSSTFIRNIINEVGQYTSVLLSFCIFFSEILVLFGISILLIYVNPKMATATLVLFGIAGYAFNYFSRSLIKDWGIKRHINDSERLKNIQQGLSGIKEIKIMNLENFFIKKYQHSNFEIARVNRNLNVIRSVPRLYLELLAVILICIFILYFNLSNNVYDLIPTLGLFAAAAFRVLPLMNRLVTAYQKINFSLPAVSTIYNEIHFNRINNDANENIKNLKFDHQILFNSVDFKYDSSKNYVFKNLNFGIKHGDTIGIFGESGPGKTTFVNILTGLINPSKGNITVDGNHINSNIKSWQKKIGYVPQKVFIIDDSILNNICLGVKKDAIDIKKINMILKQVNLDKFISSCENNVDTVIGENGSRISGGQIQRIGIARAIYSNADILIFDESTSSLDPDSEKRFLDTIKLFKNKKTIIIISHKLSTLSICNKKFLLKDKKLLKADELSTD